MMSSFYGSAPHPHMQNTGYPQVPHLQNVNVGQQGIIPGNATLPYMAPGANIPIRNIPNAVNAFRVDGLEQFLHTAPNPDGSVTLFPDLPNGKIYASSVNPKTGQIVRQEFEFKRTFNETEAPKAKDPSLNFITKDDLLKFEESVLSKIAGLHKKASAASKSASTVPETPKS